MNREHAQELLPIIQAFAEGKDIQCKNNEGGWHEPSSDPHFNAGTVWQIKPVLFECWVNIYNNGGEESLGDCTWGTKDAAESGTKGRAIHMREVE